MALLTCGLGCERSGVTAYGHGLLWDELPPLPDAHGFAGPFAGVVDSDLLVAGGANFPDGVPWHLTGEGWTSPKRYHERIFVLEQERAAAGGPPAWRESTIRLPRPIAYGVSVAVPGGLLLIGGERQDHRRDDEKREYASERVLSDEVLLVRRRPGGSDIEIEPGFPRLPSPIAFAGGARIGNHVYIVGGDDGDGATRSVWRLDLSQRPLSSAKNGTKSDDSWRWESLPAWPGRPRVLPVVAAQSDGRETCLYVVSGREVVDGEFRLHTDAYRFEPSRERWNRLADVRVADDTAPRCVMGGAAAAVGTHEILVVGGARGDVLLRHANELPREIATAEKAGDTALADRLRAERLALYDRHVGFSRDVLSYNAVTDRWSRVGQFPAGERVPSGPAVDPGERVATGAPVTTVAVHWEGAVVVPSGEISPGVRTPRVFSVAVDRGAVSFGVANWTVLALYLAVLVWMGFYFSRRERSTEDFFTAGGRIPWWAAGLSIFGTMLSAITYLSIPARAYGTNWSWLIQNFGILAVAPIVAFLFLPFFRKLRVTSAYEYLEARFNVSVRLFGSASFILFQFGRMGIVVLLPALALAAVTGIDILFCIVVMGVLSTLYTVLGGIEAVVWTDVLQVVVLIGGAIAAVVMILVNVGDGLPELLAAAWEAGKVDLVTEFHSHDLSWARDGVLVILLGAVFNSILPYISDQAVIQRYMTVADERQARRAIWTNGILAVPASLLFFGVGTALWVFYRARPEALMPLEKPDQIFPWFIALEMPAGVAGLVIAGVFAASMSSLDSSLHSIATAVTTDFYRRFRPDSSEAARLRFARVLTVFLGVIGTLSAILMATMEIKYLWDVFLSITGLLLGTLGGLFTVGILLRRCSSIHAWFGIVASVAVLYLARHHSDLHFLLNGVLSLGTCFIVALLSSYALPTRGGDAELTVRSLVPGRDETRESG